MGINTERDIQANLQIGPTDHGMVRLFIEADNIEIPMDFDPEEAEEIADRVAVIADKHILVDGSLESMRTFDHPWVSEYFNGERSRVALASRIEAIDGN